MPLAQVKKLIPLRWGESVSKKADVKFLLMQKLVEPFLVEEPLALPTTLLRIELQQRAEDPLLQVVASAIGMHEG
jgi:hypothetical protein